MPLEMGSTFEAAFGGTSSSSGFDKNAVQKNIEDYKNKIIEMTNELAMLRAEDDLKRKAEQLQRAISQMSAGSMEKMKEVI
jgi:phage shock protein A